MSKRREFAENDDSCGLDMQKDCGESAHQSFIVSGEVLDKNLLWRNMIMFVLLKVVGSYDSGAFSAAVGAENGIAEEWGLTTIQQGALSASVFLGCMVGCPLAGNLFSRRSAKAVLVWSLVLHSVFTFCFATFTAYLISMLSRFLIGITLSFIFVYIPVWVDDFAPCNRQSVWMALHNAGVPVGVLTGYLCGAILPSYTRISWEWAFYAKCVLMIPILAYFVRVDHRSIDRRVGGRGCDRGGTSNGQHREEDDPVTRPPAGGRWKVDDSSETSYGVGRCLSAFFVEIQHIWSNSAVLLCNVEYVCSVLAMCSLYFVVSGIQNFMTQYLHEEPFNASMETIMVGFGTAIVASPICGVVTGGILLDRLGGYHQNPRRVMIFTTAWGAGAAFGSIMCIFARDTITLLALMSLMLFCGGCVVPPGSGRVIASLPDAHRPAGAALAQMMYNFIGNFSGPLVCGSIAQWTGELRYGINAIFCCSVVGLLPMIVLLVKAPRSSINASSVVVCDELS